MTTIYELEPFNSSNEIIFDEMELGLRVAITLFVENETSQENFIRVMEWYAKWDR